MHLFLLSLLATLALAQSSQKTTPIVTHTPSSSGPSRTSDLPPINTPTSSDVSTQYKLFGWHNCDSGKQNAILDALNEKHQIMGSNSVYYIDWNAAGVIDYFGDPSQLLYMQDAGVSYRDKISQNIRNLYSFGNGWWFQGNEIEIFCGDGSFNKLEYKDQCKTLPGHMQFVNRYGDDGKDAIMVCDSWFKLGTLAAAIQNGKNDDFPHVVTNYENRALSWISALAQKVSVVPWPGDGSTPVIRRRSYNYGDKIGRKWMTTPSAIKMVAKNRNTNGLDARLLAGNADTWAWWAMTMYIQDKATDDYPAYPYVPQDLKFEWEDRT